MKAFGDTTDRHRKLVIRLSKPGEVLATGGPFSTVNDKDWFFTQGPQPPEPRFLRLQLHNRLLAQTKSSARLRLTERKAVIVAGPPGAGKSTILKQILSRKLSQYLVIDADHFKRALLREALRDGSYESKIKPQKIQDLESAGEAFFPLELSSLVHEESSLLATRLRNEAIQAGTNIVIDTVLSSPDAAQRLGHQLEAADYSIEIIDVEAPYEIVEARIAKRWQDSYTAALTGEDTLGGRWVPSEYTRALFPDTTDRSLPEEVAQALAFSCGAVTRYRVYRTIQEAEGERPAIAGWETDLRRKYPAGPLLGSVVHLAALRARDPEQQSDE